MRLSQEELLKLVTHLGGYDNAVSTQHMMCMLAYFKAHRVGPLDVLATTTKMLEVLAALSPEHHALVCENLLRLHQDLQREQN